MARKRSGGAKAKKLQSNIAPSSSVDDDVGYTNGHYYYRNGNGKNGGSYKNGSDGDNNVGVVGIIPIWMKRIAVVIAIIGIFHKTLWPWGIASQLSSSTERSNYASIDYTNDSLMSKRKLLEYTSLLCCFCMLSLCVCVCASNLNPLSPPPHPSTYVRNVQMAS